MDLVLVESPAKAKTIEKYLGPGFRVMATYGHVRDLEEKDGAVAPDADFALRWQVDERAERNLAQIARAAKSAQHLYLATDPDREGEAISWHVREILAERKALAPAVKRVVFNEITKRAVTQALEHPRDLDRELIDAYLARRALDYLVGYTLSPVLWRKLPGSRSAGRVQSVALRLICERETEIEAFVPREYWTVEADLAAADGQAFTARLVRLDGKKLDKFDLGDEAAAKRAVAAIAAAQLAVIAVETKRIRRAPAPPFTTSTLQQEAARKLGFSARQTMQVAQRLYEGVDIGGETVGLITYMRTDGVSVADEAIAAARSLIGRLHGDRYRPDAPRIYRVKTKGAQEAHEAIRPTDVSRLPDEVGGYLDRDQARLYELIWKRMMASQMAAAELDQASIDIADAGGQLGLRATGQVVVFDGYFRIYQEGRDDRRADDDDDDESGRRLPALKSGDRVERRALRPLQHFTEPPPRYSEASLVKKLEELGIGRPSTYASTLSLLRDRQYVRMDKARFVPEEKGRVVIAFLERYFPRYVAYDFTAGMEDQLDDIADGKLAWKAVLAEFWRAFKAAIDGASSLQVRQVIDALDESLGPHLFRGAAAGVDPRQCPRCGNGRLGLKLSRTGAFIGCGNYPECRYTRALASNGNGESAGMGPRELGVDPASGLKVAALTGRFGPYLQLGEQVGDTKPKRASIPRDVKPDAVDLGLALKLLALPRKVGDHPDGGEILAGIGRFGPYLKLGPKYAKLQSTEEALTVGENRAVELLAQPKRGGGRGGPRGPKTLREIGPHPADGKPVTLHDGRYGHYVKHGAVNATVPKDLEPATLGLDAAIALLAARAGKSAKGRKKGGRKPSA